MISNLGFAGPLCKDVNLAVGNIVLNCPAGEISEIVDFGLSPQDAEILDTCMPNTEVHKCDSAVKWDET